MLSNKIMCVATMGLQLKDARSLPLGYLDSAIATFLIKLLETAQY